LGKQADIVVVGIHKPYPEAKKETFYMVTDEGRSAEEWDGDLKKLKAFQSNVVLKSEHNLAIYNGKIPLTGFVSVIFGYRLQNGNITHNADTLDMFIYRESIKNLKDKSYVESIQGLCP
ncbi:hypothetical protein QUF50_08560, partial [Thiotrichales bacterium HSG1]|nr:hypothetical protein [Thiotrichales bacterium HSG1]